ncbi:hypothetical protein BC832DRAFT_97397 [Gaertneriomyces semiglobifer]|nr:hypothetical protein BC832DRAFT_97397 [Gaertneriomyces semiglobifer]
MASIARDAPTVALVGATGYIGGMLVPAFLEALHTRSIANLRILTTDASPSRFRKLLRVDSTTEEATPTIHEIDYGNPDSLLAALTGVHVLVSAMGTRGNYEKNKYVLLDAASQAGVQVYFPSEWGTDHTSTEYSQTNAVLMSKRKYFNAIEEKGIRPYAMYVSLILETSICRWFGLDSAKGEWRIVGDGNVPVAMTSDQDVGSYALQAVLLAYRQPDVLPSKIRVYSACETLNRYADIMDAASGKPVKRVYIPLETAISEYEQIRQTIPADRLGPLIPILMAQGVYDYSHSNSNELLNPKGERFTVKSAEEYARETDGRPWLTVDPWSAD